MISLGHASDLNIADAKLRSFIRSGTSVVQEQEECIIAASLCGIAIRCREQRIHLRFLQIRDRSLRGPLEGDSSDLSTPFNAFWAVLPNEARQRVDHSKPLIAGRQAAPACVLQVFEESLHVLGAYVIDVELIDLFVHLPGNKRDEQSQAVAVTALRIARQIAFAHKMLE
jgi:hypothetical protein